MTFNDVLYRIKTTFEILDPLRVFITDKEFVKIYINTVVGNKYNVPTLGIIRNRADAQSYDYPPVCCIKPTHLSGHYIIRKQGEPIDLGLIDYWWDASHYVAVREANYKTLRPKVIIEELLDANSFIEYYCFCYMAAPKLFFVSVDHAIGKKRVLFDAQWNELNFSLGFPKAPYKIPKPRNFDEMLLVAHKLSAPFDFIRIDFYSDGSRCYVGEITNCHASAMQAFVPVGAEQEASSLVFGKAKGVNCMPENLNRASVVGRRGLAL
jgi:TupA-like ATPgrasp